MAPQRLNVPVPSQATGVGVVITCRLCDDGPCFTVWSDPSYSHYFWNQLTAIATELGGPTT